MTTDHQIDPRFRDKPYGYHLDINPLYGYQEQLRATCDAVLKTIQPQQDLLARIDALLNGLDDPMRVVVAGGFNAGKSTFLNALVNQKVMPVKAVRSTCTVNVLQSGSRRELIITRRNGRIEQRLYQNDADAQQQIDTLMKTEHASIAKIAVCCPNQRFLERFTLIDTPGLDHNAEDSATSALEVERADALIWVLHNKGAEKLDCEKISQFRAANPESPVIVILNQVDALEEDELNDALTATQAKLNAHVAAILPLSAKLAGEGQAEKNQAKLDASYFYELRSYLQHNLFDQYRSLQERIRFRQRSQSLLVELQQFLSQNTAQSQPIEQQLINHRYFDLGDGTVLDRKNGLQWMRCALGQTWDGKTCVGEANSFELEHAKDAVKNTHHAGYKDWRLPALDELKMLLVYGQHPTIDQQAFPNTQMKFWTSSIKENFFTDEQYSVSFELGESYVTTANDAQYVRPVRTLKERYLDLGEGMVLDMENGLQWMRCALGQTWDGKTCVGEAIALNWEDAKKAATNCRHAKYTDWRLPTIDELKTLVYCSSGQPTLWNATGQPCTGDFNRPTIDQEAFPNTPSSWFWSGSPNADDTDCAWYVYFGNGYTDGYGRDDDGRVRLVRVGK